MKKNNLFYRSLIIFLFFFVLMVGNFYCNALISETKVEEVIVLPDPPSIDINKITNKNITAYREYRNVKTLQALSPRDNYCIRFRDKPMICVMNSRDYGDADGCDHTWNVEIKDKIFHIYIDRDEEKVIITGRVDYFDEIDEVERIIKMRAPINYKIINKIMH